MRNVRSPRFAPLLLALCGLACGGESRPAPTPSGDGGTRPPPLGADTLGGVCTGACGANDDRKCSTQTDVCGLCLVDPGHELLTYCSQDCTTDPCPTGWTCEAVKAFGQPQVERECVSQPRTCGDGVVQASEVCEANDPTRGECVMRQGWRARCGDGVIQSPEVCDGPTQDGRS